MAGCTRALLFLVVLVPAHAFAYYDFFYGWSADGSFYAYASSGTDLMEQPSLCLSDEKAGSTTWPKGVARPTEGACTSMCKEDTFECEKPEVVQKWVHLPRPSRKGPHGEIVTVKVGKGSATVAVMAGGKKVASADVELVHETERPGIREVYWRPDGGAVAVYLGYPDPPDDQPGYPPPRYLTVIPFGRTSEAAAANARGMTLLRRRDYPHAGEEFRKAIAADPRALQPCVRERARRRPQDGDRRAALAGGERRSRRPRGAREGAEGRGSEVRRRRPRSQEAPRGGRRRLVRRRVRARAGSLREGVLRPPRRRRAAGLCAGVRLAEGRLLGEVRRQVTFGADPDRLSAARMRFVRRFIVSCSRADFAPHHGRRWAWPRRSSRRSSRSCAA